MFNYGKEVNTMLKKYEVAISENGICYKCKMVSEEEYNQLKQESVKALAKEKAEKQEIKSFLSTLANKINELEHEIKVLKGEEDL